MSDRTIWLTLEDKALLDQCAVDTYRSRGPGGQKRNKTSSAVRLRHGPSSQVAIAEESRSQHENKAKALRRLRRVIALELREALDRDWKPPEAFDQYRRLGGRIEISRKNGDYPIVIAAVLDAVASRGGRISEAAALLGTTTSQLSGFLVSDGKLLDAANRIRRDAGLHPLRST